MIMEVCRHLEAFDINAEDSILQQSKNCAIISHAPSAGTAREMLLKNEISSRFPNARIYEGFICSDEDNYQSSQLDFILCKNDAEIRFVNPHIFVEPEDVLLVTEVKTTLENKHLTDLDDLVLRIKSLRDGSDIKIGLFAYRSKMGQDTLLKYFGIEKDWMYGDIKRVDKIQFPNIDFLTILETNTSEEFRKPFFIGKDKDGLFQYHLSIPVINRYISILKSKYRYGV